MAKGGGPTTADSFRASQHMSLVHISTYMCPGFVHVYIHYTLCFFRLDQNNHQNFDPRTLRLPFTKCPQFDAKNSQNAVHTSALSDYALDYAIL